MKRVSEIVTIDKIRSWNNGDIITIKAGTGAGKSYFVKNILYAFVKKDSKKILMLIHRKNCVDQFQDEIEKSNKTDTIDIMTYQKIESIYKKNETFDFSKYEYIICDEFHYFMSDAAYNKTTDMSLDAILDQKDKIRIFMSATGEYMKRYINGYKKLETKDYDIPINFNFIKELTFFNKDNTLEQFINEAIKEKKKSIFFIQSAKKAYELYKKYEEYCIFNCSKNNGDYYKYVNIDKIDNMLKNEKFNDLILITTTCMDAGVNIRDIELQHIVCDVKDTGTLIQCLGRKRLEKKNDKIYLYIKTITNQQLGGIETQLKKKIEMAEYLRKYGVKKYIMKYPREYDHYSIVYDETVDEDDKGTKKVNDLMYFKCITDMVEMDVMKNYGDFGYCKYLAQMFGFYDDFDNSYNYRTIEEDNKSAQLESYLDSIVGKVTLQAIDRKELIEKINVKQNGKLLKSLNSLNSALQEQNFNYYIKQFETTKRVNGTKKKYKSAWKVMKLVEE
ncbi:DNA helicase [Alkalihalophilus pseudofirmus]|nr:DNA helicase [Alkalihalophilus pseudofirmus]